MGRRAISVLLSATMTFGMLAAVPMTASADDVQNISWMFWDDLDASEDPITKGFKNVIDRFNKDYEGKYHVDPITTTLEEYYTQLNALVDADQTPDVFIVSPGPNLTDYVKPGVAAPLDDYLNADGWKDTFSSDAVFTQQTYDGKIYAVPLNIAAACCYYNKDIFKEAGVEVPATYDELLDACKKIKDAGYTPITISAGTAWCLSMLAGYLCDREGVDLDAVNTGKESWVQDKTIDAGKKLLELSQYFQETAAGDSNDDATMAFAMGEAAILIQGSWAIGQMNAYNPDIEETCGVFQFPAIEGGNDPARVIAKSDSLAMNAKTKSPEACVALMKYFTDDEAQRWTAEQGGKIPVTNVKYDADKAPAQMADVMKIFTGASSTFGFYNESLVSSDAGSYFDNQMVSIYKQEKTPEEAFQAVEDWYAENGYRK
ncbi:MAG: extracellular solute-binding protein [Lachnospiraceae bacterium]|uniref:ABC transporter substrate-binding protein n=1 Tax=Porcincola sp. LCP21S3_C12 TaxID=3438798 RepID=UPI002978B369|nr:extracellular solute-binding protein [Lachnospiraceae bacterium]